MSSTVSSEAVATSLLDFVQSSNYPELDTVLTSELPGDLGNLLDAVTKAELAVKNETRSLSSGSATQIDEWIAQATAIQVAIARSRDTARSIVAEASARRALATDVEDASAKVALLRRELALSETLEGAVDTIQIIVGLNDAATNALVDGESSAALDKLLQAEKALAKLRKDNDGVGACRAITLVERRINNVRSQVVDEVLDAWRTLVVMDSTQKSITVLQEDDRLPLTLEAVVNAMSTLGLLNTATTRLQREVEALIVRPRLSRARRDVRHNVDITKTTIRLSQFAAKGSVIDVIRDIFKIIDFISETFPFALAQQLIDRTVPSLLLQLVSQWLDPSLPLSLESASTFNNVVEQVKKLADHVDQLDIELPSEANLSTWLRKIPQSWLAHRKEASLADMRAMCYGAVKRKKTVERIETQTVKDDDVMYGDQSRENSEQWEEDWGEEGDAPDTAKQEADDSNAWEESNETNTTCNTDEDDAEGWGWGDDEATSPTIPETVSKKTVARQPAAQKNTVNGGTREITLREHYTITEVPEAMLILVRQILADASTLASDNFPLEIIKPAGKAMGTLPTLLLAMYRATAGTLYNDHEAGQMLIYNDTVYLNEQLQTLFINMPHQHPLADRLRTLDTDMKLLLQFSRRTYGREMDSQRTILSDIISSTSGFVNCTAPLNTKQYAAVMQDAVNRVRHVNEAWRGTLSDSVRLQSLGSLTGTLVKQMISDILERADDPSGISDDQSRVLKSFCDKVAELANLFQKPEEPIERHERSLVYIYTPDWFRFRYLSEILVASLADIRYLWTEGELKLEFRPEEVVDLMQALFADSSHRRDAIRDIKSS